ncbi:efflux RND transporter periplasmic adaptor subunit [Parvularcula dongshanensis]|uniref:Membrane fusion protein (Multidrug efflux system) n=1 Tax=Parvularcula dongshanensis TaxID=1173995 RepID=A0A840I5P5_9PROT|nr:efflux RND transporter periplasmic adaptor subunit [Parvularcula dongshanensis]MBB4659514.1 membrane fusion protein (multidrug efflux system) [Parvularcula dongshanensis]
MRTKPALAALALLPLLLACGGEAPQAGPTDGATGGPPGAAQPPAVSVQEVVSKPVDYSVTLPGRVAASRVSEVRPQVNGIVTERLFEEGEKVEAGAPLYQIDAAPYQAAFDSAQAQLQRAQAAVSAAQGRRDRFEGLVEGGGVSRQDYDDAVAAAEQAAAEVALARAARDSARIDLERTTISAPIAGHVGRALVTEGALVTAGQGSPLAVVTALDPVYVDVTQSSAELLRWKRAMADGQLAAADGNRLPVTLTLEDGSTYDQQGTLALTEVSVDPSSSSVTLRASFPNPNEILLPGMFVRAHIVEGTARDAVLVPQAAVSRAPDGTGMVFVLGDDNTAQAQPVQTQRAVGDHWVVSGLTPGTRIITDGFGTFQPGQPVTPQQQMASNPSSASAAPVGGGEL